MKLRLACLFAFSLIFSTHEAVAQNVQFGQNKVKWSDCAHRIRRTPHVDIYYCPGEEKTTDLVEKAAEQAFGELVKTFGITPKNRPPIFWYTIHNKFEETNLFYGDLDESMGGFTEFEKRRIALPFNASYAEVMHVVKHEMVHWFELAMLDVVGEDHRHVVELPLWWHEGLAEYLSEGQSTTDDMLVRDLVSHGTLPSFSEFNRAQGFEVYYLGGEVIHYLFHERFTDAKLQEFYKAMNREYTLTSLFRFVFGESMDRMSEDFSSYEDRKWRKLRDASEKLDDIAMVVPTDAPFDHRFDFKPLYRATVSGDHELFFATSNGYSLEKSVRFKIPKDGEISGVKEQTVIEGGKQKGYESFHNGWIGSGYSRNGLCDGREMIFVAKDGERDALVKYDLNEGRETARYASKDILGLRSPACLPDGKTVIVEGRSLAGISDLYSVSPDGRFTPITNDIYADYDPTISSDSMLVWTSDRTQYGETGATNLFLKNLKTGETRALTYGQWHDQSPVWSRDGKWIYFSSDRSGVSNIYRIDRSGGGEELTNIESGAYDPQPIDDSTFAFVGFSNFSFSLYVVRDSAHLSRGFVAPANGLDTVSSGAWSWLTKDEEMLVAGTRFTEYRPSFNFRGIHEVDIGASTSGAGYGGTNLTACDDFNDRCVSGNVWFVYDSHNKGVSLLNTLNGYFSYTNLSRRLQWSAALYGMQYYGGFFTQNTERIYHNNEFGGAFSLLFPMDKYYRFEGTFNARRSARQETYRFDFGNTQTSADSLRITRTAVLAGLDGCIVHDNTLWLYTGPIAGTRWRVCAGGNVPVDHLKGIENGTAWGDYRNYWRLGLRSAYALRVFGYYSGGSFPDRFFVYGSELPRLYGFYDFYGSRGGFVQQEVRFPMFNSQVPILGNATFPVEGALFADIGNLWVEHEPTKNLFGSYGMGLRMPLAGPFILRLDVGRKFHIGNVSRNDTRANGKTGVRIGFGYNY